MTKGRFDKYIEYLKEVGPIQGSYFIEDFEPIGLSIIGEMEDAGLIEINVDDGFISLKE